MREEEKKKKKEFSKKLAFYRRGTVMQGWLAGSTGLDFGGMTSPERAGQGTASNRLAGSGKLIPVVDLPRPDRIAWDVAASLAIVTQRTLHTQLTTFQLPSFNEDFKIKALCH